MNPVRKTVRLSVSFPGGRQSGWTLEKLEAKPELRVNILRGRVSSKGSSFELEVSGAASQVSRLFKRIAQWGAAVSILATGVSQI